MFARNEFIKHQKHSIQSYTLGNMIELTAYGNPGEKAILEAVDKLQYIDNIMSVFKTNSEVSQIGAYAGLNAVEVSDDTYFVIEKAIHYSELSGGAFDPTIFPIVNLWRVETGTTNIPQKAAINKVLNLVNYKDVLLFKQNKAVMLKKKGQAIDLGSIAKGYAVDEIKKIFIKHNISSTIINIGGNICAIGDDQSGDCWNIRIQNPLKFNGNFVGIVSVINKSVVTSGNYERYFIKDGKRYHHIIDPKNGYPTNNGIIGVTIISDNSIDGDALSTCIFVMGLKVSLDFIEALDGIDAIIITEDKKVFITSGLINTFTLCDDDFCLVPIP